MGTAARNYPCGWLSHDRKKRAIGNFVKTLSWLGLGCPAAQRQIELRYSRATDSNPGHRSASSKGPHGICQTEVPGDALYVTPALHAKKHAARQYCRRICADFYVL